MLLFRSARSFALALSAFALFPSTAAQATLAAGAKAPPIRTGAARAGKALRFDLAQALRKGPVVLYFFPKAFTQGCTLEAHAFAEASDEFAKAGATVIGLSNDDLPTLQRFSREACRDKFAVGAATPATIRAYDVAFTRNGAATGLASRTSYVIGKSGRIAYVHSDPDYRDHVRQTLAAVHRLTGR